MVSTHFYETGFVKHWLRFPIDQEKDHQSSWTNHGHVQSFSDATTFLEIPKTQTWSWNFAKHFFFFWGGVLDHGHGCRWFFGRFSWKDVNFWLCLSSRLVFWECLSLVASMDGSAFGKHLIVSAEFGNFKPPEEHFLALHTVFCLYNCLTLYLRLPNKAQIKNL